MDKNRLNEALELINKSDTEQGYYNDYLEAIKDLRLAVRVIHSWLMDELPTTAPTTPTAPTTESQWGVGTNICRTCGQRKEMLQDESICQECMTAATQPSLQSDQVDTQNGRVEHNLDCVHNWHTYANQPQTFWCNQCGALKQLGRIAVPAVHQHLLTSVKQPSKESVENSQEESAQLQSNAWSESWWWCEKCQHFCQQISQQWGNAPRCNGCYMPVEARNV